MIVPLSMKDAVPVASDFKTRHCAEPRLVVPEDVNFAPAPTVVRPPELMVKAPELVRVPLLVIVPLLLVVTVENVAPEATVVVPPELLV